MYVRGVISSMLGGYIIYVRGVISSMLGGYIIYLWGRVYINVRGVIYESHICYCGLPHYINHVSLTQ